MLQLWRSFFAEYQWVGYSHVLFYMARLARCSSLEMCNSGLKMCRRVNFGGRVAHLWFFYANFAGSYVRVRKRRAYF